MRKSTDYIQTVPNSAEGWKIIKQLRAWVKANPRLKLRVDVKGRLGYKNPNRYKYSRKNNTDWATHSYIRIGDAQRFDIYLRPKY